MALGHSASGDIIGVTLILLFGSALFTTVANQTTGITLAHSSFGNATLNVKPNINITSTVGFVPIIQLIPFVFGILVLLATYAFMERWTPKGL